MKKKLARVCPIAALLTLVLAFGLTACRHFGHSPDSRMEFVQDYLESKLDLTKEQSAKLVAVHEEMKKVHASMKEQHKAKLPQLFAMIESPEITTQQLMGIVTDHESTINANAPLVLAKVAEFHKSLTLEQKQKLVELIKDKMSDCMKD